MVKRDINEDVKKQSRIENENLELAIFDFSSIWFLQ